MDNAPRVTGMRLVVTASDYEEVPADLQLTLFTDDPA